LRCRKSHPAAGCHGLLDAETLTSPVARKPTRHRFKLDGR
jgi:hypothetical protein